MKHNPKITFILLAMFVITQFIGLAVQQADIFFIEQEVNGTIQEVANPQLEWIQPEQKAETKCEINSFSDFFKCTQYLYTIIIAFVIAIGLLFFLSKFDVKFFLRLWFFLVVAVAIWLCVYAFEILVPWMISAKTALIIPTAIALPLAYLKIYQRNFLIHNLTELLVYPGIAAIFVPLLNVWTIVFLLIIISIYDIWAVWHSGIMQKMAKYQISKLKVFSGFFVPYMGKKAKMKLKKLPKSQLKKKKVKVNVGILGGGDVVFPILALGVMLKTMGLGAALLVIAGATCGLAYLFFISEKKKFYPAMPFISAGIFAGMILSWLIF